MCRLLDVIKLIYSKKCVKITLFFTLQINPHFTKSCLHRTVASSRTLSETSKTNFCLTKSLYRFIPVCSLSEGFAKIEKYSSSLRAYNLTEYWVYEYWIIELVWDVLERVFFFGVTEAFAILFLCCVWIWIWMLWRSA